MFALIIAIISIALIVATIAATMYHGGDTLTQGRNRADAAAVISGAQQVGGAAVMFLSLEGTSAANVAELVSSNYLSSAPDVDTLELAGAAAPATPVAVPANVDAPAARLLTATIATDAVCQAINQAAGAANPASVDGDGIDALPYGCVTTGRTFVFKF